MQSQFKQIPLRILFVAGVAAFIAACASDNSTSPVASTEAAAALVSAPIGFDQLNSSFVGDSAPADGFTPWHQGDGDQFRASRLPDHRNQALVDARCTDNPPADFSGGHGYPCF